MIDKLSISEHSVRGYFSLKSNVFYEKDHLVLYSFCSSIDSLCTLLWNQRKSPRFFSPITSSRPGCIPSFPLK